MLPPCKETPPQQNRSGSEFLPKDSSEQKDNYYIDAISLLYTYWFKFKFNIVRLACLKLRFGTKYRWSTLLSMSLITRKPVFGVSDRVRLKWACSATEASYSQEISDLDSKCIILSKQWTTKALIRLRGCAGWSAPLLFAYGKNRFSLDMACIKISFQTHILATVWAYFIL